MEIKIKKLPLMGEALSIKTIKQGRRVTMSMYLNEKSDLNMEAFKKEKKKKPSKRKKERSFAYKSQKKLCQEGKIKESNSCE